DVVNGSKQLSFDSATLAGTIGNPSDGGTGEATFTRSILDAGPTAAVCVSGTVKSGGDNIEHGASCSLTNGTDRQNRDPMLLPLTDNGGGTLPRAIAGNSPAVDAAGLCADSLDQRKSPRPRDGNGDGTAKCDIGAYELDPSNPPSTTTTTTPASSSTTTT